MKEFKMWKVEYKPTGSGEKYEPRKVWISTGDELDGVTVNSIIDVPAYFEKVAAINWKTFETKYAIDSITLVHRSTY